MKSDNLISFLSMFLLAAMLVPVEGRAEEEADTLGMRRMDEVVVTGTRNATDMRHLTQTVSVVGRAKTWWTSMRTSWPATSTSARAWAGGSP